MGNQLREHHGKTYTKEYNAYCTMKSRCTNPNVKQYKDYGGRGIKVCVSWSNSFQKFLDDMGPKPTPKHTLDRIDNDGDYSPENCKWSTYHEQRLNQRRGTVFNKQKVLFARALYDKHGMSAGEIAEILGTKISTTEKVVYREKWKSI